MATRIQVIEGIATSTGMNPMTLERLLRVLGGEGLIPVGGVGRRTGHFDSTALTHVVLGLGAPQPSDASAAVRILGSLRQSTNALHNIGADPLGLEAPEGCTLFEWTKLTIERLADPAEADRLLGVFASDKSNVGYWGFPVLIMTMEPPSASISVRNPKNALAGWYEVFTPSEPLLFENAYRHRRVDVRIDLHVLAAAGRLLANTLAHQPSVIPDPVPGRAGEGEATPETTKASGTGIHEGLLSDVPATRAYSALAPAASLQEQSATKEGRKQSLPELVARESRVRQPVTVRTRHHGANWSAASPA